MALHADPHDLPEGGRTERVRAADVGPDRQIVADGIQQFAHGALVCPACRLPVFVDERIGAGERLTCGFCEQTAPARDYVIPDVFDTVPNEVYLIARLT